MKQIQVKSKRRACHTALADPPTVDREIARIWFSESQPTSAWKPSRPTR